MDKFRGCKDVKDVYDVTLMYYNRWTREVQDAPNIWYIYWEANHYCRRVAKGGLGREYAFRIHVDRYAIDDIPVGREGEWLMERWREKDERIAAYAKETGGVPCRRLFCKDDKL